MRRTIYSTLAIGLIVFAVVAGGYAQSKVLPVVKDGLINELRRPGFKPAEMVKFINLYGVNFVVTPELEAQLLSVGATPAIIKAAKENYRLPGGKRASFLNAAANVADAEFVVDGVGGAFTGTISNHPLAPGNYRVTAKRTGYMPETQTAMISEPGKSISISFTLKPVTLSSIVDDAKAAFERKDLKSVEELCRQVLAREPSNPAANMLLGRSLYIKGDFVQGADHVMKGLQGGDSVTFVVVRRKQGKSAGEVLEFGSLVLQPTKIALMNRMGGDTEFEIPYAKIVSLQSDKKDGDWRIAMKVAVPKSSGKDDRKDVNLYMSRSRIEMPQGQSPALICSDCEQESRFIADLITKMRKDGPAPQKQGQ